MNDLSIKQLLAERGITVGQPIEQPSRELFWNGKSLGFFTAAGAVAAFLEYKAARNTLFELIAHGDQDHCDWLENAINNHFASADRLAQQSLPEPILCDGDRPVGDRDARTIFEFVAWMSARVAQKRGGKTSHYLSECADFMTEVVGRRLSVSDRLPKDRDWRPTAAIECADAMMEYDQ